jgi:hypothetical protein
MPYYFYVDDDGDQTALPCTERLTNERVAARIGRERFIPLLSIKGRPEIRLGSFMSLAGCPIVGRWPVPAGASPPAPPSDEDEDKPKKKKKKAKAKAEDAAAEGEAEAASERTEEAAAAGEDDEKTGDTELDSLLASLKNDTPAEGAAEEAAAEDGAEAEMDPELAKLLKGM